MCTNYINVNRNKQFGIPSFPLTISFALPCGTNRDQIENMGKQTTTTACGLDYKCVSVCVFQYTKRKTTVIFCRCYNLCENASFLVFWFASRIQVPVLLNHEELVTPENIKFPKMTMKRSKYSLHYFDSKLTSTLFLLITYRLINSIDLGDTNLS